MATTCTMGTKGALVVPKHIREALGLEEGCLMLLEIEGSSVRLRKAVAVPVEEYSPRRRAQFILSAAVDRADYEKALDAVRALGLDPSTIPHVKPE